MGAGTSRLVDHLLEEGYREITLWDISGEALQLTRKRLADRAGEITWIEADITEFEPVEEYDLWHDRAVFHFLTEASDRKRYRTALDRGLKPGGHLIMAAFSQEAPRKCSGLKVRRYSPESLQREIREDFDLLETVEEIHLTPVNKKQKYVYCRFRRRPYR